ncbi:methyl-accepting chemotaxis protein [Bacillus dakarensis]|uniref:methyl-accepting chemotaxis protein n=1 Tax=Robertmurraya dakarensis TaxID=1926278 RepID=UPI001F18D467|nr:methyl-accepting chemotaxis protein [Bacillus dakarensis]
MKRIFRSQKRMRLAKFKNLKIGWKYGLALVIVVILFGVSTLVTTNLIAGVGEDIEALERRSDRAIKVTEMGSLIRAKSIRMVSYLVEGDPVFVGEYEDRKKQFDSLAAELSDAMDTSEQKRLFEKIIIYDKRINEVFTTSVIPSVENGDIALARSVVSQANIIRTDTVELLDELRAIVNQERDLAVSEAQDSQIKAFNVLLISMVVSILVGGLLVFLVSRSVSRNLQKVVAVSDQIAEGNLDVELLDYDSKDEIGQLTIAINAMAGNLKSMIRKVSQVSETVSSQSEELTQSANEVKAGSEQVAVTMQELAAGSESQANHASNLALLMESFSSEMLEANKNGDQVYESSNRVLGMTTEGTDLMGESVKQMATIDQIVQSAVQKVQGLDTHSQKITKLVSVIHDIANQTNLLALNAAIEAARAGEHGKGFAVVADEVRKLAEQVSISIKDITEIVSNIQKESANVVDSLQEGYKEVEKGTGQIKTTGNTFNEITKAIKEMSGNIKNITNNLATMTTSSNEMGAAIQEIASVSEEAAAGIEQTSASSQQTSSSMEEVAENSEELSKLAEELNGLVRQFKF